MPSSSTSLPSINKGASTKRTSSVQRKLPHLQQQRGEPRRSATAEPTEIDREPLVLKQRSNSRAAGGRGPTQETTAMHSMSATAAKNPDAKRMIGGSSKIQMKPSISNTFATAEATLKSILLGRRNSDKSFLQRIYKFIKSEADFLDLSDGICERSATLEDFSFAMSILATHPTIYGIDVSNGCSDEQGIGLLRLASQHRQITRIMCRNTEISNGTLELLAEQCISNEERMVVVNRKRDKKAKKEARLQQEAENVQVSASLVSRETRTRKQIFNEEEELFRKLMAIEHMAHVNCLKAVGFREMKEYHAEQRVKFDVNESTLRAKISRREAVATKSLLYQAEAVHRKIIQDVEDQAQEKLDWDTKESWTSVRLLEEQRRRDRRQQRDDFMRLETESRKMIITQQMQFRASIIQSDTQLKQFVAKITQQRIERENGESRRRKAERDKLEKERNQRRERERAEELRRATERTRERDRLTLRSNQVMVMCDRQEQKALSNIRDLYNAMTPLSRARGEAATAEAKLAKYCIDIKPNCLVTGLQATYTYMDTTERQQDFNIGFSARMPDTAIDDLDDLVLEARAKRKDAVVALLEARRKIIVDSMDLIAPCEEHKMDLNDLPEDYCPRAKDFIQHRSEIKKCIITAEVVDVLEERKAVWEAEHQRRLEEVAMAMGKKQASSPLTKKSRLKKSGSSSVSDAQSKIVQDLVAAAEEPMPEPVEPPVPDDVTQTLAFNLRKTNELQHWRIATDQEVQDELGQSPSSSLPSTPNAPSPSIALSRVAKTPKRPVVDKAKHIRAKLSIMSPDFTTFTTGDGDDELSDLEENSARGTPSPKKQRSNNAETSQSSSRLMSQTEIQESINVALNNISYGALVENLDRTTEFPHSFRSAIRFTVTIVVAAVGAEGCDERGRLQCRPAFTSVEGIATSYILPVDVHPPFIRNITPTAESPSFVTSMGYTPILNSIQVLPPPRLEGLRLSTEEYTNDPLSVAPLDVSGSEGVSRTTTGRNSVVATAGQDSLNNTQRIVVAPPSSTSTAFTEGLHQPQSALPQPFPPAGCLPTPPIGVCSAGNDNFLFSGYDVSVSLVDPMEFDSLVLRVNCSELQQIDQVIEAEEDEQDETDEEHGRVQRRSTVGWDLSIDDSSGPGEEMPRPTRKALFLSGTELHSTPAHVPLVSPAEPSYREVQDTVCKLRTSGFSLKIASNDDKHESPGGPLIQRTRSAILASSSNQEQRRRTGTVTVFSLQRLLHQVCFSVASRNPCLEGERRVEICVTDEYGISCRCYTTIFVKPTPSVSLAAITKKRNAPPTISLCNPIRERPYFLCHTGKNNNLAALHLSVDESCTTLFPNVQFFSQNISCATPKAHNGYPAALYEVSMTSDTTSMPFGPGSPTHQQDNGHRLDRYGVMVKPILRVCTSKPLTRGMLTLNWSNIAGLAHTKTDQWFYFGDDTALTVGGPKMKKPSAAAISAPTLAAASAVPMFASVPVFEVDAPDSADNNPSNDVSAQPTDIIDGSASTEAVAALAAAAAAEEARTKTLAANEAFVNKIPGLAHFREEKSDEENVKENVDTCCALYVVFHNAINLSAVEDFINNIVYACPVKSDLPEEGTIDAHCDVFLLPPDSAAKPSMLVSGTRSTTSMSESVCSTGSPRALKMTRVANPDESSTSLSKDDNEGDTPAFQEEDSSASATGASPASALSPKNNAASDIDDDGETELKLPEPLRITSQLVVTKPHISLDEIHQRRKILEGAAVAEFGPFDVFPHEHNRFIDNFNGGYLRLSIVQGSGVEDLMVLRHGPESVGGITLELVDVARRKKYHNRSSRSVSVFSQTSSSHGNGSTSQVGMGEKSLRSTRLASGLGVSMRFGSQQHQQLGVDDMDMENSMSTSMAHRPSGSAVSGPQVDGPGSESVTLTAAGASLMAHAPKKKAPTRLAKLNAEALETALALGSSKLLSVLSSRRGCRFLPHDNGIYQLCTDFRTVGKLSAASRCRNAIRDHIRQATAEYGALAKELKKASYQANVERTYHVRRASNNQIIAEATMTRTEIFIEFVEHEWGQQPVSRADVMNILKATGYVCDPCPQLTHTKKFIKLWMKGHDGSESQSVVVADVQKTENFPLLQVLHPKQHYEAGQYQTACIGAYPIAPYSQVIAQDLSSSGGFFDGGHLICHLLNPREGDSLQILSKDEHLKMKHMYDVWRQEQKFLLSKNEPIDAHTEEILGKFVPYEGTVELNATRNMVRSAAPGKTRSKLEEEKALMGFVYTESRTDWLKVALHQHSPPRIDSAAVTTAINSLALKVSGDSNNPATYGERTIVICLKKGGDEAPESRVKISVNVVRPKLTVGTHRGFSCKKVARVAGIPWAVLDSVAVNTPSTLKNGFFEVRILSAVTDQEKALAGTIEKETLSFSNFARDNGASEPPSRMASPSATAAHPQQYQPVTVDELQGNTAVNLPAVYSPKRKDTMAPSSMQGGNRSSSPTTPPTTTGASSDLGDSALLSPTGMTAWGVNQVGGDIYIGNDYIGKCVVALPYHIKVDFDWASVATPENLKTLLSTLSYTCFNVPRERVPRQIEVLLSYGTAPATSTVVTCAMTVEGEVQ